MCHYVYIIVQYARLVVMVFLTALISKMFILIENQRNHKKNRWRVIANAVGC